MPELTPEAERELTALDDALAGRPVPPDLADLGELAVALRADRPEPSLAFGQQLDARVQRGFRGPDPRKPASPSFWARLRGPGIGVAVAAAIAAIVLVPSAFEGRDDAGVGGSGGATALQESSPQAGSAESRDSASELSVPPARQSGSPGTDARTDRRIERSAALTLAAPPREIDAVSRRIQAVTRRYKGFVLSSSVSSGDGGSFELRIPTRNLDAALAELAGLGAVRERTQRAEDITAESVSARDRLTDARTERKSLLRQLGAAVTTAETASIRARLRIVSREIRQARAAVRRVQNRASFATVIVDLVADADAGASGPADDGSWTPADAARDALRVLEVTAGIALIALAVGLPLALVAALVAAGARWGGRRRRERALDAV